MRSRRIPIESPSAFDVGRRLALAFALSLSCISSASAQPDEAAVARARELFERGVQAYDRGVYYEALQAFQEAYQLRPHPAVRVNIANCYDKLDRPAEAIQHFEQFLGSGAGSPQQQQEVMHALERLRKRVGRLVLRVSPSGARIVIDDDLEYRAPVVDPIFLKPGRHQLRVTLDAHETALRVVDIHAEGTSELTVSLAPLASAAIPPAPVPATSERLPPMAATPPAPPPAAPVSAATPAAVEPDRGLPATVWLAGGVTLAALLTSIVSGQLALAADREFNGELAAVRNMQLSNVERAKAWAVGMDAADRAKTFAVTTDVLLSTAVVGAVLTTVLYLNDRPGETEPATAGSSLQLRF